MTCPDRYLVVSNTHLERLRDMGQRQAPHCGGTKPAGYDFLLIAFPSLRFHVKINILQSVERREVPERIRNATLKVHRPVDARALHQILTDVRVRYSLSKEFKLCRLDEITRIEYPRDTWIVNEDLVSPAARYRNRLHRDLELDVGYIPEERLRATLLDSFSILPVARSSRTVTIRLPNLRLDVRNWICQNVTTSYYY
jgi:hypothetical protein